MFTVFLSSVGRIRSWSFGWSSAALTATLGQHAFNSPLQIRLAHCVVRVELGVPNVHLVIYDALDDGVVEVAIAMENDSALVPRLQKRHKNETNLDILFWETIGRIPPRRRFANLRDIDNSGAVVSNIENRYIDLEFINLVNDGYQ